MSLRRNYSIIEYHSTQERYKCGYCKSPNTSHSHGMTAESLTVQHYQYLIDRGWRRSGCYCYKPMMKRICCPLYTIKCAALEFKTSKSQRKIIKRVLKFINNELTKNDKTTSQKFVNSDLGVRDVPTYSEYEERVDKITSEIKSCESEGFKELFEIGEQSDQTKMSKTKTQCTINGSNDQNELKCPERGKPRKAKLMRIERKRQKLINQGKSNEEIEVLMKKRKFANNQAKSLEELMESLQNCPNKLEIKLVRVMTEDFVNTFQESASLFQKYQLAVHNDSPSECDEKSYYSFLVHSPLQAWCPDGDLPQGYGSFHQQYWLNGVLIAVGVIDILPNCLSSVYFFYDPKYSFLSLGTFSSLQEIYLLRKWNRSAPNFKYYYMGYYIHSCTKMQYKAKIKPSYLLCPETYNWFSMSLCIPKLEVTKYCRFDDDATAIDEDAEVDIEQIPILHRRKVIRLANYLQKLPDTSVVSKISEYASLVGKKCALSIIYYMD